MGRLGAQWEVEIIWKQGSVRGKDGTEVSSKQAEERAWQEFQSFPVHIHPGHGAGCSGSEGEGNTSGGCTMEEFWLRD